MRIYLILVFIFPALLSAAWFDYLPTEVTEPDGSILQLFASGDEFANHLHDQDGFSIIAHEENGYHYYAELKAGLPRASQYRVGSVDPNTLGFRPHINVSDEEYRRRADLANTRSAPNAASEYRAGLCNINIFLRFYDQTEFEEPRSFYNDRFSAPYPEASVASYFAQTSYGNMNIHTYSYPLCDPDTNLSYQDTHPRAYYLVYNAVTNPIGYEDQDEGYSRLHQLLYNALNYVIPQISTEINLDMNGDGRVDNVSFIARGPHAAWAQPLWAHSSSMVNISINGVTVNRYTFQPQPQSSIRTLTHEMYHVVGAPDLYHYTFDGISPVGAWDLMETGTGHMGAHMKRKYGGWIPDIPVLTTPGTYTLLPISNPTNNCYRINIPGDNYNYFVLEYRQKDSDIFEENIPGTGLLVYRIRHGAYGNDSGAQYGSYDEVYIYRPDGSQEINGRIASAPFNAIDTGDAINAFTNPNCWLPYGGVANLNIHSIQLHENSVSFFYDPSPTQIPPDVSITDPVANTFVHNAPILLSAEAFHPDGDIQSLSFYINGELLATLTDAPYTIWWTPHAQTTGLQNLSVSAVSSAGLSSGAHLAFWILNLSNENWVHLMSEDPAYTSFSRGAIPISVALDLNLGSSRFMLHKIAFQLEDDPWGDPEIPGLVSAQIKRFHMGAITDEVLIDIGDLMYSYPGRNEFEVYSDVELSGQIAVILHLFDYQRMVFDTNGLCGHSWITEPNRPWMDAMGRGILGAAAIELLLSAQIDNDDPILSPQPARLLVYPNPITHSAEIKYELDFSQNISLDIHNLRGQHVRSLHSGNALKGTHTASWDARDHNGSKVANGIYLLSLKTRNGSSVLRKMVICR